MAKIKVKKVTTSIGDEKPKIEVFKTQQEIDNANQLARRLSKEKGLVLADEMYVAKKIGDPKPEFVSPSGQPIASPPQNIKQLPKVLPPGMTIKDVKSEQGIFWYDDPHTGDPVEIDGGAILAKYGPKKTATEIDQAVKEARAKIRVKKN